MRFSFSGVGFFFCSATRAQVSAIMHIGGFLGPFCRGDFRRKMMTPVGNSGYLRTSNLSPHLRSPHLDFPEACEYNHCQFQGFVNRGFQTEAAKRLKIGKIEVKQR